MTFLALALLALVAFIAWRTWHKPDSVNTSPTPSTYTPPRSYQSSGDNWEGSFWEVPDPIAVTAALSIDYMDGKGQRTSRTVDVQRFGEYEQCVMIIGRCRLRQATRTFRSDRISKCVDLETGELVDDVGTFLKARYESSPEAAAAKLIASDYDALRVLLYVGKADGQLRAAEKAVICQTCIALANDSRMTPKIVDELFATMDVPTLMAFKQAVGRLAKRGTDIQHAIFSAAQAMVATQKTVHSAEKEALDYMQTRFKL